MSELGQEGRRVELHLVGDYLSRKGAIMATSSNDPIPPDEPRPPVAPSPAPSPEVQLRRLNFEDKEGVLHILPVPAVDNYTFANYQQNRCHHLPIRGYCVSCEGKGLNQSPSDPTFILQTISHGAHSDDFFQACGQTPGQDWKRDPVMFVFQSPGKRHRFFSAVPYGNYQKWPTGEWYWIHGPLHLPPPPTGCPPTGYPDYFQGGKTHGYGHFVLGVMLTFKLANVYVTNLVKCGLHDSSGKKTRPLKDFAPGCVRNCYDVFLRKELDIFQPKIIFAVGAHGAARLKALAGQPWVIQQLPHPAAHGLPHGHFQVLYYWLVLNGLRAVGIVDQTEYADFAQHFYTCFGGSGGITTPPP
jgi:hypothetical protein